MRVRKLGYLGFEIESLGESSVSRLSGIRLELVQFSSPKTKPFFRVLVEGKIRALQELDKERGTVKKHRELGFNGVTEENDAAREREIWGGRITRGALICRQCFDCWSFYKEATKRLRFGPGYVTFSFCGGIRRNVSLLFLEIFIMASINVSSRNYSYLTSK